MIEALVNIELGFALWFAAGAALVAGLARGLSGFGAGLIFMPLAAATLGPQAAAPILLLVDSILVAPYLPGAWRGCDKRAVGLMTVGAYAGVPLGAAALAVMDPTLMRWLLVALILALLMLLVFGFRYRGRPTAPATIGVGAVSGLLSGAAQVGGPPAIAYWLGSEASPKTVRADLVVFIVLAALGTAIAYVLGGLLTADALAKALVIGPFYAFGLFVGARLFGFTSEALFRRVCYALIALAAAISLPALDGLLR